MVCSLVTTVIPTNTAELVCGADWCEPRLLLRDPDPTLGDFTVQTDAAEVCTVLLTVSALTSLPRLVADFCQLACLKCRFIISIYYHYYYNFFTLGSI